MNTLEKILSAHAEIVPTMEQMKTYSVNVFNLCSTYIREQLSTLPKLNMYARTLVATLDPAETPRTAEATVEALRTSWPDAEIEVVFDRVSNKYFVFVV